MNLESLAIKNFKSFIDEKIIFKTPDGSPGSGVNIFVGENNCGKSNLFEAIDFLRNGTKKNLDVLKNNRSKGEIYVDAVFAGDIESVISTIGESEQDKIRKLIQNLEGGASIITIRRQSKIENIKQGKKEVSVDVSKLLIMNPETGQFENVTGIPAIIQSLFDVNFLWADTNPNDETKYTSTSLSGKLLAEITKNFQNENEVKCKEFLRIFKETFNDDDSGLQGRFNEIAKKTEDVLEKQFKRVAVSFKIEEPVFDDFFKKMKIEVNDGA